MNGNLVYFPGVEAPSDLDPLLDPYTLEATAAVLIDLQDLFTTSAAKALRVVADEIARMADEISRIRG